MKKVVAVKQGKDGILAPHMLYFGWNEEEWQLKKLIMTFLCGMFIFAACTGQVWGAEITVYLNGKQVEFPEQKPIIVEDRTMVPFRVIAEHPDVQGEVSWNGEDRSVTIIDRSGKRVIFGLDTATYRIIEGPGSDNEDNDLNDNNGEKEKAGDSVESTENTDRADRSVVKENDVAPVVLENRQIMLPLRAFAEAFDFEVNWDGTTRSVSITEKEGYTRLLLSPEEWVARLNKNKDEPL